MADKLNVSLVSPERELFSGTVDQVDLPAAEGAMGILPNHAPLMTAVRTGAVTLYDAGRQMRYFVQGGFADVTPAGLTILAERAMPIEDMTADTLRQEIATARAELATLTDEGALAQEAHIDGLEALFSLV